MLYGIRKVPVTLFSFVKYLFLCRYNSFLVCHFRPMHEITFSTIDKPKLLSEVNLCTVGFLIGMVYIFKSLIHIFVLLYTLYILTDISLPLLELIHLIFSRVSLLIYLFSDIEFSDTDS